MDPLNRFNKALKSRFWMWLEFEKFKLLKGHSMGIDPITSIFNFLSTPVGQKIAGNVDDILHPIIVDIISLFHKNMVAKDATPASVK